VYQAVTRAMTIHAGTLIYSNLKDGPPVAKVVESLASCHFIHKLR